MICYFLQSAIRCSDYSTLVMASHCAIGQVQGKGYYDIIVHSQAIFPDKAAMPTSFLASLNVNYVIDCKIHNNIQGLDIIFPIYKAVFRYSETAPVSRHKWHVHQCVKESNKDRLEKGKWKHPWSCSFLYMKIINVNTLNELGIRNRGSETVVNKKYKR